MKKKWTFPIILLLISWVFNMLECLISSTAEISLKNIITLKSFIFTLIITFFFYYFNHEKK